MACSISHFLGSGKLHFSSSAVMSNSSDDSACYPYQSLDDSPTATSSPVRSSRPRENLSSESTALLIGNDSSSPSSLSGQNIFIPDDDTTLVVNSVPQIKHEHKKLQRQDHVTESDERLVGRMLEPLAEQEFVHTSQDRIPILLVEEADEVFQSSNPNVTFKKPSLTSCEWWDDDPALYLHSFRDAACTTSLTSTPICAELAPILDFHLEGQCIHIVAY